MNILFLNIVSVLTLVALLFLMVIIVYKNWRNNINRTFAFVIFSGMLWVFANFMVDISKDPEKISFWSKLTIIGPVIFLASFLHFTIIFRRDGKNVALYKFILIYLPSVIFLLFINTPLNIEEVIIKNNSPPEVRLGSLYYYFFIYFATYLSISFYQLYVKFKQSYGITKNQVLYIFLGILITAIFGLLLDVILPLLGISEYVSLGPFFTLFFFVSTTYAIVKYRLMDIRIVIQKGLIYSIFLIITVLLYIFFIIILAFLIGSASGIVPFISAVGSSAIIVLTYKHLERFFQRITNNIFFKVPYNYEETLKELGEKVNTLVSIDLLLKAVMDTINKSLKVKNVKILLEDKDKGVYLSPAEVKLKKGEKRLMLSSERDLIIQYLKEHGEILVCEEIERKIFEERKDFDVVNFEKKVVEDMKRLNVSLAIPLIVRTDLVGVMLLGSKSSHESYTSHDLNMLSILGHQFSIAINNAQLYSNLEKKVKERTAELESALEKLKRINKEKSEFISIASHQLRTPLTAIKGIIDMEMNEDFGELNKKQMKYLSKAYDSSERLIKLVNDLLDISRIEMGKDKMVMEEVNIEDLISEIIDEFDKRAADKDIKIIFKPKKEKISIKIDSSKIRQVLENLIDNAIKYTEEGSVKVNIKKDDDDVCVSVEDTGMGLTEQEISNLFHKFTRGRYEKDLFVGGTGLGLYIARKIVESHGGKIWCESRGRGFGSTFYFKLPIK